MAKGIRFYQTGGPEVMQWESLEVRDPGAGEVRVRLRYARERVQRETSVT